jgi:hypothetical protein
LGNNERSATIPSSGWQQGVQKRYQQVFVYLRAEKLLEAKIGEGIYITIF